MSSWKKAAQAGARIHKERHQPENRASLGILEKKKDYKQRANDYNKKKSVIKKLRKKALEKNPDEFYFHMVNSTTDDGVHHEIEKDDDHSPEQLQLMQTQDLRYITMRRSIESKKIEMLRSQLHLLDAANKTPNTHIFFVDSKNQAKNFNVAERLNTHPSLVVNRVNRMKVEDLKSVAIDKVDKQTAKNLSLKKKKMYAELAKRIQRERELGIVQRKLEMKKLLAAPGTKPTKILQGTKRNAPIYKWKFERKK